MKVEGLQAALFNLCINGNATSAIQDRKSISVSKDLNVSSVTFALIKLLHSVTGTAAGGVPAIYKYEAVDQEALAKLIMQYLVTVATEKEKGLLTQYGFSFPEPQPQDRQLCISSSVFAVLKEKGVFSAGLYNVNSDVFNLIFRLIIDVDDAANLKFIQLCVSYIAGAAEFISLDRAEVAGVVEAATVFNLKRDRAIQALQKFARTLDQIGKKAKGLIGVPPDVVQSFKMPVKRLHERFNEYRGMIDDADTNERVADSLLAADGIEDKTEAAQQLLAAIQVAKLSDDDLRDKGARRRDKITALARSLRSPDSRITLFSLLIQAYQRQNILPPAGSPDDLRKASIEQQRILRRLREIEAYLSQPVDQPGSADKFVQALKQEGQKSLQHLVAIKGSLELVPGFLERDDVALFSHLLFLLINRMEDVLRQPEANPEYLRNIDFLLNTEVELNTFFGPELDRSLCELFGINAELIAVSQAVEKVEQNIRGKTVHPEVKAEFKEKVEEVKSQLTKKFTGMNRQTVEAQALLKKAERVSKEIYTFFQSYFEGEHYALPIGEWMNAISAGLDQRKRLIDPLNMFLRMADQKKEEYLGDSDGRAKTPSFIEKFWKAIDEYIQSISGEIKARSEIESSAVERCTKLDQLISVKEDVRKVTPDVTQTLSAEDQAMVQRKREYVGLVGDEIGKLKFSMLHPMLVIEQHFPGQSMSVDGLSFEQWVDTLMALIQERMRDLSVWAQLYGVCALYHERYYDAKEAGLWEGLKPDKERKAALEGELPGAEAKVAAGLGVLDFTRLNWFVSGAGAAPQRELTELSVSLLLAEINRFAATHAEDCDWKAQDKFQYFWQYAKDLMPHYDFCLQRAGSLSEKGQAILEQYATIIPDIEQRLKTQFEAIARQIAEKQQRHAELLKTKNAFGGAVEKTLATIAGLQEVKVAGFDVTQESGQLAALKKEVDGLNANAEIPTMQEITAANVEGRIADFERHNQRLAEINTELVKLEVVLNIKVVCGQVLAQIRELTLKDSSIGDQLMPFRTWMNETLSMTETADAKTDTLQEKLQEGQRHLVTMSGIAPKLILKTQLLEVQAKIDAKWTRLTDLNRTLDQDLTALNTEKTAWDRRVADAVAKLVEKDATALETVHAGGERLLESFVKKEPELLKMLEQKEQERLAALREQRNGKSAEIAELEAAAADLRRQLGACVPEDVDQQIEAQLKELQQEFVAAISDIRKNEVYKKQLEFTFGRDPEWKSKAKRLLQQIDANTKGGDPFDRWMADLQAGADGLVAEEGNVLCALVAVIKGYADQSIEMVTDVSSAQAGQRERRLGLEGQLSTNGRQQETLVAERGELCLLLGEPVAPPQAAPSKTPSTVFHPGGRSRRNSSVVTIEDAGSSLDFAG